MSTSKCRHRGTWLIISACAEWCYECGAWRPMKHLDTNTVAPAGRWTRPTGIGGPNPAKPKRAA